MTLTAALEAGAKIVDASEPPPRTSEKNYDLVENSSGGWRVTDGHKSEPIPEGEWSILTAKTAVGELHYLYETKSEDKLWLCDIFSPTSEEVVI